MTVEFNFDEEKPKSERDERIVRILEQFSRLSPEKQEAVFKYIDYLEKKVAEKKVGQNPVT